MTFFKKLTETAKNTANTIGTKSAELVSVGKLKMEKVQKEGKIRDKKLELGGLIYEAYAREEEPNNEVITQLCQEIQGIENEIADLDKQMKVEAEANPTPATKTGVDCPNCGSVENEGTIFCSKCGHKFISSNCKNCGQNLAPDAKFCADCGTPVH